MAHLNGLDEAISIFILPLQLTVCDVIVMQVSVHIEEVVFQKIIVADAICHVL